MDYEEEAIILESHVIQKGTQLMAVREGRSSFIDFFFPLYLKMYFEYFPHLLSSLQPTAENKSY